MKTHRHQIIDSRWVKLWRDSDPAEDQQENGCHRLCFTVCGVGGAAGIVTTNNIGCDWLRVFLRERGLTVWFWRVGFGIKWREGQSRELWYYSFHTAR
jgi:hypothetical protein